MNAELTSTVTSEKARAPKEHCIITLDLPQYFFYQSECIELHAPDGNYLETVGHGVREMEAETNHHRLKEQIFLVEALLGQIHHSIELPREAVSALADIFYRMQGVCSKFIV